jgi:possible dihydropyrimidinase
LLDPNKKKTIRKEDQVSRSDYAPLEGLEIQGCIEEVFLRGKLVAKGGKVLLENQGKYLKRKKFQPVV